MHQLHSALFATLALVILCLGAAAPARADTVLYTFDSPLFTFGHPTPLLNQTPDSGPASFRASFTSSPRDDGFEIDDFEVNPLFSGQFLFDPFAPADSLTLAFNTPVDQVQLDWAVVLPGWLELISPAGVASQTSIEVGGPFSGGTLIFSSSAPFSTFQLRAFTTAGDSAIFAIDNLKLNTAQQVPIPEPATITLLCTGLIGITRAVRRTSRR